MPHWFIATAPFSAADGDLWHKYVAWSGLRQLDEVVSLDPMLCPTLLPTIEDAYWPYIVDEDFLLHFFVDLDFLLQQVSRAEAKNVLCVTRNPLPGDPQCAGKVQFEFLGYDLVDIHGGASALTNCGGLPDVFDNSELSSKGLLTSLPRAVEVQASLRAKYPAEPHADCHVWAISRAIGL
jgi:hypothetical protein